MSDTATTARSTGPASPLGRPEGGAPDVGQELLDEDLVSRWQQSAGAVASSDSSAVSTAVGSDDEVVGSDDEVVRSDDEAVRSGDEAVSPEHGPRRVRRALRGLTPSRLVAGLVVVVLVAIAGWFAYRDHTNSAALSDRAAAAKAASSDAVALATYDYGHLDQFFRNVKSFSTPGFGTTFDKGAQSLVKVLTQYQASSTGKLASFGVKTVNGNRITVLVVISQTVANSASKTPAAQTEAFDYGMVHQNGRWLLDSAASVH